ncbi:MAG: response regulator [Limisphaerales bacterium]
MNVPPKLRDLSIRNKLRLIIVGSCGVALVLACVLFSVSSEAWSHAETRRELVTMAELVSLSTADALERNDTSASQQAIRILRENHGILTAAIYREAGTLFTLFRRTETTPTPPVPLPAEGFHAERLELVMRIRSTRGGVLGSIYLRADPSLQHSFLSSYFSIVAASVLIATLGALGLATWLEHTITAPIHSLIHTAGRISREENFTIRAPKAGADELGQLVNSFNDMLAQIQVRDVELRHHRDHLGELIAQRTAELFQLNHALFLARDKAEDASRAKSSFLANMSHELRTPLNAIIGYSEMLIEESEPLEQKEALHDLQRIQTAGKQLLDLINEVLDLSKIEAGKMTLHYTDFDLVALARDVSDMVRPLAEKNRNRLVLDTPLTALPVHSDATKIRQTLLNLVNNACKFTHQGEVRLRLGTEETDGRDWALVQVSDTGMGMTPEQMSRLFQAFTQADITVASKFGGTGLGLAISRTFSEALGGQLTVASELNRGSTFTLRLPVGPLTAKTDSPAAAPAPALDSPPPVGAPSVLVIDDDPHARDLLVRFLQKEGYSVQTASGGEQGLLMARQLRPGLITLDVMMPEVDGWSVLNQIKADPEIAGIPVVIVTMTEDQDKGFTLGASEFLTKPVNYSKLSVMLRQLCPAPGDRPILVVEDDEISSHLLRRNLEKEGYTTVLASNGRAALELIHVRLPALILLDLMMPEMDGFAFVQTVRERKDLRGVPIIVLTAKDLTEDDKRRLAGNVAGILQKQTLTPENLQAELRAALARHLPSPPKG